LASKSTCSAASPSHGQGGSGSASGEAPRRSAYGNLAPPAGRTLERRPTLARLDREASRPKSLATFGRPANDLEVDDEEEAQAQSARAAFRSWSYTGGTRDASFKKRPKLPFSSDGDGEVTLPKPQNQRAVGFASVLSLSGWSEIDAEEFEVGVQPVHPSRTPQKEAAVDTASEQASSSTVELAGIGRAELQPEARTRDDDDPERHGLEELDAAPTDELEVQDEAKLGKSFKRKPKR
jgi:hypothetical protein